MKLRKKFSFKMTCAVSLLTLATCAVLLGTTIAAFDQIDSYMIDEKEEAIMDGYKREIKSEIQTAMSIINTYYDEYTSGKLTENEAKEKAKDSLRSFRYGDNDEGYVWIDNTDYTLEMHPILSDEEGDNRHDLTDKKGTKIIQTIFKSVESGNGYSTFWFTKSDGKTIAKKIAYSAKFDKWNWVLTTGVYTDDIATATSTDGNRINRIFKNASIFMAIESIMLYVLSIVISAFMCNLGMRTLNKLKDDLKIISKGALESETEQKLLKRKDEFGDMANAMETVKSSLSTTINMVSDSATQVNTASNDLNTTANTTLNAATEITKAIEDVANGATQQATAVQSITGNIDNINKNIDDVNASVKDISAYAGKVYKSSSEMKNKMNAMTDNTTVMTENIMTIDNKIKETNEVIKEAKGIISVIEGIAEKTKLLSLNANIEASHAGDAGKGFAVVASTIRDMSENTSNEVEEIKNIINNLVTDFEECLSSIEDVVSSNETQRTEMQNVIDSFTSLEANIDETNNRIRLINDLIKKTVEDVNDVAKQATTLTDVAETSAASTEEVNASVEELTALMHTVLEDADILHEQSIVLNDRLHVFKTRKE